MGKVYRRSAGSRVSSPTATSGEGECARAAHSTYTQYIVIY